MAPIAIDSPAGGPATLLMNSSPATDTLTAVTHSPHQFLQPSSALYAASLSTAKHYLDPLATSIASLQKANQSQQGRKRKRGAYRPPNGREILALTQLHTQGFDAEQIWGQANRILQATVDEIRASLLAVAHDTSTSQGKTKAKSGHVSDDAPVLDVFTADDVKITEEDPKPGIDDEDSLADSINGDIDPSVDGVDSYNFDESEDTEASQSGRHQVDTFVPDKLGLNDGFFSIDDFNKQSDFLEQRDARGEDDGAASDEEDVDWDVDPLGHGSRSVRLQDGVEHELGREQGDDNDDEGDGPVFADANVDSFSGSDQDEILEPTSFIENTNDIMYKEFFEPPPRKLNKTARRRALPKTQPPGSDPMSAPSKEDEMQRAISDVRRDIFEDDLEPFEISDASDPNPDLDPQSQSSHQKRQARLTAEIRRLESEAVAKKPWTMSGEARAGDRPLNSLLEEDLEFERAGKPVPVITQEVTEDMEALIKRRIVNRDFDEVIRRRPGTLTSGSGKDLRRGRFELEDGKPTQSLAEIYEAQHLKEVDPNSYVDKRSEALKKEHAKIETLWKDVSGKLDALTNLHFKPKPVEASVKVISDVPTILMEDARPNTGSGVGESMLAPQEVYKAGEARNKATEVNTRSGLPVAREEMTREEKLRRRRREKERIKKAGGTPRANGTDTSGNRKSWEKNKVALDLKKWGVRVIGKKGEIRDIDGKEVSGNKNANAGTYKL